MLPEVVNVFDAYHWPGNVRELENVIERVVAIEDRETITTGSLPREMLSPRREVDPSLMIQRGFNLTNYIDEMSRKYLDQALLATGGNLKEAADMLGLSYRSIRYLADKYQVKTPRRDEN